MNAVHCALREGTAHAHARVDAVYARFDLADRTGYARFLAAHAAALLPVEAALDAGGAERVVPDWPRRRRGSLIVADLADLGAAAPARFAAACNGVEAMAGALYVLEGSRFGGRIVARRVAPGLPRRYVDAGQANARWRALLERLEMILGEPAARQSAVEAALRVFAAFERSGSDGLKG